MTTNKAQRRTVGERVMVNNFLGRVERVLDGQLDGMVEVRLSSGLACVDLADCEDTDLVKSWKKNAPKWNVMARAYPASLPVPCKNAEGEVIVLDSEEEAQELARTYRERNSRFGACQPHYFAQAVES